MRNSFYRAVPFLLLLFLTGCYDVPYLLRPESEGVFYEEALGDWKSIRQTKQSRTITLSIQRESSEANWYSIKKVDYPTEEVRFLRAIVHKIGNDLILSYQDNTSSDFSIFRVMIDSSVTPAQLKATALSEGAPRFATSEQLVEFLRSPQSERWFQDGYLFSRVETSAGPSEDASLPAK
jgi:hypothetical protein